MGTLACPACGARSVNATLTTTLGLSCYCDECGCAWHHDRRGPFSEPIRDGRRATDEPAGVDEPAEAIGQMDRVRRG